MQMSEESLWQLHFFSEKNKETAGETPAAMETEICPAELHNLPKTVF